MLHRAEFSQIDYKNYESEDSRINYCLWKIVAMKLGQNFVKYFVHFWGNGVSRKKCFWDFLTFSKHLKDLTLTIREKGGGQKKGKKNVTCIKLHTNSYLTIQTSTAASRPPKKSYECIFFGKVPWLTLGN